MRILTALIGLGLLLLGVYFLGRNIVFTTNVSPYWWRGIAADASILCITLGIASFFAFPREIKEWGWILIILGILLIFMSSRAILNPTSLWEFFLSMVSFLAGYQLLTRGRINF
ncbi:conserved hypothetical protein [Gloeothece citriformis PCC 7424]|uniref:Uncharacterized protein n=1 Tax=Gloeothece citriformis (strain PCC 7424) TaxID=65393 RepID=B7KK57_GLOC7|nr:hypothetical protein [Gloeothece citriformis]ACK70942.1 conserved hypothetical protein [Gloeothece citriformis PCC 7424]